ncbi:DUF4105 domain-containing protein, partial [bacterium]|nr:DUF4105 domain-containing protein [bacterium]
MKWPLFFQIFLSISLTSHLPARASIKDPKIDMEKFAHSKGRLNLLYYEKYGSDYKSRVTSEDFFASGLSGRTNPVHELLATIELFRSESRYDKTNTLKSARCRFPSRYLYLKRSFELPDLKPCDRIEDWKSSYQPDRLYLVYASQYVSNPASIFGHSFLLIGSKVLTEGLWISHNYAAAMPPNTPGWRYILGGMIGWFYADYSVMPFYQRLFQYGSIENRDLWMYQIKLSPEELDFYIAHMWELVHLAKFDYYFLDENCAGALFRTFS